MVKVLYVGHYREPTGYGEAALNSILALDYAQVSVICKPIFYGSQRAEVPKRIEELEQKSTENVDTCILHTLPTNFSRYGNFKHVGRVEIENNIRSTGWVPYINLLNELWVPNQHAKNHAFQSGVNNHIRVAHHTLQMGKYRNQTGASVDELKDSYNFCFIGEFIARKNIGALLTSFHSEFGLHEPVNLFLKISGGETNTCLARFNEFSNHIKNGLKLRKEYKKEVVIAGHLEKNHLLSVMAQCHCIVSPSHAESWMIPVLEANALGLTALWTAGTGPDEFAYGSCVNSSEGTCNNATDSLPTLYSADTTWRNISVPHLRKLMRQEYESYLAGNFPKRSIAAKTQAMKYDFTKVGYQLKDLLCEQA